MEKLIYTLAFTLAAFLIIYSCSTEQENTIPPALIQTPEPEPPAPTQYTLTVTAGGGGTVSTEGGTYDEGTNVTVFLNRKQVILNTEPSIKHPLKFKIGKEKI